jgi:hypothetical protein
MTVIFGFTEAMEVSVCTAAETAAAGYSRSEP